MNIRIDHVTTRRRKLKIIHAPRGTNFRINLDGRPAKIEYIEFTRHELDAMKNLSLIFPDK